jgi:hypothetical protein
MWYSSGILLEIYFDESKRLFWKCWVQDPSRWVARISDVCRHRTGGHHNQNHTGGMNVGYSSTYTITNVVLVLFLTVHFFVVWFPAPIKLTVLSHDTIFHPIFLWYILCEHKNQMWKFKTKRCFKISWCPLSIRQYNENFIWEW